MASKVTGPETDRERVGPDGPRAQRGTESPGPAAAGGGAVGGRQTEVGGAPRETLLLSEAGNLDAVPPTGVCRSCRRPHQLLEGCDVMCDVRRLCDRCELIESESYACVMFFCNIYSTACFAFSFYSVRDLKQCLHIRRYDYR